MSFIIVFTAAFGIMVKSQHLIFVSKFSNVMHKNSYDTYNVVVPTINHLIAMENIVMKKYQNGAS